MPRPFSRLHAALCLACLSLLAACQQEAPPPQPVEAVPLDTVRYEEISRRVTLSGTVTARVESDLSFQTTGRVAERLVDLGDHVEAGQVLARLDGRQQAADLAAAQAAHEAAQTNRRLAQVSFKRQAELLASGQTTRTSYDEAQEALLSAQSTADTTAADIGTAQEAVDYTVLRADAPGVITERMIEEGQVVAAAQAAFSLARDGERDADFAIYEALLASTPPGGIEVTLLSDPTVTARARVREVSPVFDTSTGTVPVSMSLLDPPEAMSLGSAVSGTGLVAPERLARLPQTALDATVDGPAVWVVDAENRVSLRPVTVRRFETGAVLIADGIEEGETYVTRGRQLLHPGQTIRPADSEGAAR